MVRHHHPSDPAKPRRLDVYRIRRPRRLISKSNMAINAVLRRPSSRGL
jgi:hypothetical protein